MGSMWGEKEPAPSPNHSTPVRLLTSVLSLVIFYSHCPLRWTRAVSLQLGSLASRDTLPLHNDARVIAQKLTSAQVTPLL